MSEDEAKALIDQYLQKIDANVPGGVALELEKTIHKPYGWVFFYQSKRFIESGDIFESLLGNSPIVVEASNGKMTHIGTHAPVADLLRDFEAKHGLVS